MARLSTNVRPTLYDVHLRPDLSAFTFSGTVRITVSVEQATKQITLHALQLNVGAARFRSAGGDGSSLVGTVGDIDATNEWFTIDFDQEVPAGDGGVLEVEFDGVLNDKLAGFYRSKYERADGTTEFIATTQFQPTDARRAFPCFDEPAMKAEFDITLTFDKALGALSNMKAKSESVDGDKKTVAFDRTPRMSSYLIAFAVGNFEFIEATTNEGVRLRVYTAVGKKELGRFALDVSAKVLSLFTEYFGVPYPLPKSDALAVGDLSFSAMENWGLITYRPTALLISDQSTVEARQRVAYIVSHELAHQWFGNLVTPEYWTQLWLNEGFATYMGWLAVAKLFPQWPAWEIFQSTTGERARYFDALSTTHPITTELKSSHDINSVFDAVSYSKGASVLRMLAHRLGEDALRKGLKAYLTKHKYRNTETDDLWSALSDASGVDVKAFTDKWVLDAGYPVISVKYSDGKFDVTQERFKLLRSGGGGGAAGAAAATTSTIGSAGGSGQQHWQLAIAVQAGVASAARMFTLYVDTAAATLPEAISSPWFVANAGQAGLYRVLYDEQNLKHIGEAIKRGEIATIDRLGVLSDVFALARAGYVKTTLALSFVCESFVDEQNIAVWQAIDVALGSVLSVFGSDALRARVAALYRKQASIVGWQSADDSDNKKLLRALLLARLVACGEKDVIDVARDKFFKFYEALKTNDTAAANWADDVLPSDLRSLCYAAAVRGASGSDNSAADGYAAVLDVYYKVPMHEAKIRALRALGTTNDAALIDKFLKFLLGPDVRKQDIFYGVWSVAAGAGRDAAWQWLQANFADLEARYGKSLLLLARIVEQATKHGTTAARADEIEAFFAKNPCASAPQAVKQSIESVRIRAAWHERDRDDVAAWAALHESIPQ